MNEKNAEISARIDEIICILHTNPSKFANALGYGRAQTIYDILNGKSAPSYDFFKRFCESGYSVFINLRWVFTGRGAPIIEDAYWESDIPYKAGYTDEEVDKKREAIRSGIKPVPKSVEPLFDSLMRQIKEQAEEIGRLKERIAMLSKQ